MHLLINRYNKVIIDDNSSFSGYTDSMRRWTADNMPVDFTAATGYIYIGAPHTFSSRFFRVETANTNGASLSCEYFSQKTNDWRAVKNFEDETSDGVNTFSKSGFMSWDLPDDWERKQINGEPELPYSGGTEANHGYYWIRLRPSTDLSASSALSWLGLIWTNQDYLKLRWFEVDSEEYLPPGKTDWYETIEMATRDVGEDLNIQNLVDYEMQAKDIADLANLTSLKALCNILLPMVSSETLREMRDNFKVMYTNALRKRIKGIDKNQDGKLSGNEDGPATNTVIRRH